ncbi:hypothetical protein MDA_GLEAN10003614 [Myotis davidii]|uniref:Uncharacterized protein n=1 Tax=Myotis davidii TaxID=225400 RepID=L5LKZ9_MYODS|nr:hypothetical protein MDA_GLEAN10003614 [Myotis davidii]
MNRPEKKLRSTGDPHSLRVLLHAKRQKTANTPNRAAIQLPDMSEKRSRQERIFVRSRVVKAAEIRS